MSDNDHQPGAASPDAITIPVLAEELSVATRVVERRRVRIRKSVADHVEIAAAQLSEDVIEVTRRTIDKIVESAPPIRQEGDLTIIPVLEEVLFIEKKIVLKEEIIVRRRRETRSFEEAVSLRSEEVTIEEVDTSKEQT